MLEFAFEYGLFLAKAITWVVAIVVVIGSIAGLIRQSRDHQGGDRLEVRHLNQRYEDLADVLNGELLSEDERKAEEKARKARDKAEAKAASAVAALK